MSTQPPDRASARSPRRLALLACAAVAAALLAGCEGVAQQVRTVETQVGALVATPRPSPTPLLLAPSAPEPMPPPARPAATRSAPALAPAPTGTPASTELPSASIATDTPDRKLMGVGSQASLVLRTAPAGGARVAGQVPGSRPLWVEGRSADGRWWYVRLADGSLAGWTPAGTVAAFGDPATIPAISEAPAVGTALPGPTAAAGASASASAPAATSSPSEPRATRQVPRAPGPGGMIAFKASAGSPIYLVRADGSGLQQVADGMDPALSPDGSRLAYARWGSPSGIYVRDLRTGEERSVAEANRPRNPVWSADGQRLTFTQLLRLSTCLESPFGCLTEDELRQRLRGQECVELPMVGRICIGDFPRRPVEENGLVQVDAGGGGWRDLPADKSVQAPTRGQGPAEIVFRNEQGLQVTAPDQAARPLVADPRLGSPAMSPDGTRLLAQAKVHDRTEIFLFTSSGQLIKQLTAPASGIGRAPNNAAPAWSPDGSKILFLTDREGSWRLYQMNADGSGQAPFLARTLADIPFAYDFAAERVASWGP